MRATIRLPLVALTALLTAGCKPPNPPAEPRAAPPAEAAPASGAAPVHATPPPESPPPSNPPGDPPLVWWAPVSPTSVAALTK